MDLDEDVLRRWRDQRGAISPLPHLALSDDGFELGLRVPLGRLVSQKGELRLSFEGGRERARARLACAYDRSIDDHALDVLRKAAIDFARGEGALAYIRLAHARLAKFDEPLLAAFRVFCGDMLMDEQSLSPRELLKAIGLDEGAPVQRAYNPDELRNPKGMSVFSGRWTTGGESAAASSGAAVGAQGVQTASLATDFETGFLRYATSEAVESLANGLASGASRLAPIIQALHYYFHANDAGPVQSGVAPDYPDVSYSWAPADGELTVWRVIDGQNVQIAVARQAPGGLYVDQNGKTVARATTDGLIFDWRALGISEKRTNADFETESSINARNQSIALAQAQNKPQLCPAPSKDRGLGNAYQSRVTGLPPGIGVWLNGVAFDGCRLSNGFMVEAKGLNYVTFLTPDGQWRTKIRAADKLERQMQRQSDAALADGRFVEWHVAEEAVARKIAEMAEDLQNIIVIWDPEGTYAD